MTTSNVHAQIVVGEKPEPYVTGQQHGARLALMEIQPLATVSLDHDGTRGVLAYHHQGVIWLLRPGQHGDVDTEAPHLESVEAAIEYVERAWGADLWDLQLLVPQAGAGR